MKAKAVRYVTVRRSPSGRERFYWQRRGFPLRRLSDDPAKMIIEAERLNRQADGETIPEPPQAESWAALIKSFRESEHFKGLSRSSQSGYLGWMNKIGGIWGKLPVKTMDYRVAWAWLKGIPGLPSRRQARATLSALFQHAREEGLTSDNPIAGMRLPIPKGRDRYVLPAEFARAIEDSRRVAPSTRRNAKPGDTEGPSPDWFVPGLHLLLYTSQRPSDTVALPWPKEQGLQVRQAKTRALVYIPIHRSLAAALEAMPRRGVTILVTERGKPVSWDMFNKEWNRVRKLAGLTDIRLQDFRRTAVVMLAEAGCTVPEIAALTGHSIKRTQQIIDTYYVATRPQAEAAIAKWEEHESRRESNVPRLISAKKSNVDL